MTSCLSLATVEDKSSLASLLSNLTNDLNGYDKISRNESIEKVFEHIEGELELIVESVCQRIDSDCEKLINETYKVQEFIIKRDQTWFPKPVKFKCHWFLFRLKNTFKIPYEIYATQRDLEMYYSSELKNGEIVTATPRLHYREDTATLSVCARFGTHNYKRRSEYSPADNSCNTVKRICTKCYWARGLYSVSAYIDWHSLYETRDYINFT
jgi:hypothetical protein